MPVSFGVPVSRTLTARATGRFGWSGEAMALSNRVVVMSAGRVVQIASPHETYEQPANAFVADFLGRTNTIEGRMIRPERIAFAQAGLAGTLKTRVFQGNHWLCQVETPAGMIVVIRQNDGTAMPREGETVHLAWPEEAA